MSAARDLFKQAAKPPTRKVRPAPFSLRLTQNEREALIQAAASVPLGAYIKAQLFNKPLPQRRVRGQRPVADHEVLARILAQLGQSRMASNLNQIARASYIGALPVTPELEADLRSACAAIREVRDLLMQALGFRGRDAAE